MKDHTDNIRIAAIQASPVYLEAARKLMPTAGERLVWAQGDGGDLEVYDLPMAQSQPEPA